MVVIIVSIVIAFFTTLIITPALMKFLLKVGIVGIDQHKKEKPTIPTSGGICVAIGILAGLLSYIGLTTILYGVSTDVLYLFAIITSILIVTLVGIFDDLNVNSKKSWNKGRLDIRIGLPQWVKPLLTLPAAIPLMVILAGDSVVNLPILGIVDVGILYPLLFIPVGVVGVSNAINMLGGFNGLESGMGIVYMLALGVFALLNQNAISILFLVTAATLVAFIKFNWYPAKILPGDSLTYLLGAVLATGVVIGDMERLGLILVIPFFIEFLLKLRSKFKASSLGKLRDDGTIENSYGKKIYSLTHVVMNLGKLKEYQIALIFIGIEILFVIWALVLYLRV